MYGEPKLLVLNEWPEAYCLSWAHGLGLRPRWSILSHFITGIVIGYSTISEDDAWRKTAEYVEE